MEYKQAFYSQLENMYLGVQIQDHNLYDNQNKSGFLTLLKIKSQYFQTIKSYLEKQELNYTLYNHLYNFFDSYLNETGTPFFYNTPMYKNIYAKVYTNSKDTSLFYKTQNLYYVKSDTIYHNAEIKSEDSQYTFIFDVSYFIPNADNNKNKAIFKFKIDEEIRIYVLNNKDELKELAVVFKQNSTELSDDFMKALKNAGIKLKEEEIKKILKSYAKQNEVDFFIHKDARGFLQEQFNLWMFKYVLDDITDWSKVKIDDLNMLKSIAFKIIDFIADFEDELKAIWCKPKFAKNVHYVFSLDTIYNHAKNSDEILESIFKDKGFNEQIQEWQELKLIDDEGVKYLKTLGIMKAQAVEMRNGSVQGVNAESYPSGSDQISDAESAVYHSNATLFEKYKFLPLDTKYLSQDNYYKLLGAFTHLDEILNGELIKSDNFQALNSLMPKYKSKIDLIYIDPPFNTGSDFEYKDKFQDSTWLSLIHNRLELAREFLSDKGSFYLHLDHNANYRGRELLNEVFGEENFRNEIVWGYRSGGASKKESMPRKHDNIWLYSKTNLFNIYPLYERQYYEVNFMGSCNKDENNRYYMDTLLRDIIEGEIQISNGNHLQIYNIKPVLNLSSEHIGFGTQKPEGLLHLLFDISESKEDSIIFDYHLGSGTTIATAHKLGRKWLGVEMGEHFYKVIIPRMKKVLNGFVCGISKEVEFKGGGAFRYYELESYEEALEHCEYTLDEHIFCHSTQSKDLKQSKQDSIKDSTRDVSLPLNMIDKDKTTHLIDYRKSRKLIKGLKKGENICLDMNKYDKNFDIFLTMSNLLGLKIKSIFIDDSGIQSCKFENDEIVNLENIDLIKYPKLRNLIWWEK